MSAYKRALKRLSSRTNYEEKKPDSPRVFGLEPMKALWEELDHPARDIPTIHVAGTKGKGSTCWYLGALVRSTGLKVGVYTSPHLVSPCERISVNGVPVTEGEFADLVNRVCDAADRLDLPESRRPTWFDLVTAVALLHFASAEVPVIVLEAGLGGRLDSTNVCSPACTVITRIGLDHMKLLGDTIPAIAMEKAGIIKSGVPVVTCQQEPDALRVIDEVARINESPCHVLGQDFFMSLEADGCDLDTGVNYYTGLVKAAAGRHQWENAALAVRSFEIVSEKIGIRYSDQDVRFALSETVIPGRLQPWDDLILDGAHNPLSMSACADGLREEGLAGLSAVIAMKDDKDVENSLRLLRGRVDEVWCVPLPGARGVDPKELARQAAAALGVETHTADSLSEALEQARKAGREDPILVTGSIYLVGEALRTQGETSATTS